MFLWPLSFKGIWVYSFNEIDATSCMLSVYLILRFDSMDIFQCLPTAQEVLSMLPGTGVVQPLPISLDSYSSSSEYMTFI